MNRARTGVMGVLLATALLLTTGCNLMWPPSDPGGGTCPEGSYTLQHTEVSAPLSSPLGDVTVSAAPGSVTLVISGGTWTLQGTEVLSLTGTTILGELDGTASIDGTASGTYTVSGSNITFQPTSVSGPVSFTGSVAGTPVAFTSDLSELGDVSSLYGLSGTVPFSCGAGSALTLTFPDFVHTF